MCLLALLVYEACKLVGLKQVKAYAGGSGFKVYLASGFYAGMRLWLAVCMVRLWLAMSFWYFAL